jgi:hypothetical protein
MASRYFCPECRRQFVEPVAQGGLGPAFDGHHCPLCGGQYLSQVEFVAPFPGGDYDPDALWEARPGLPPQHPHDPLRLRLSPLLATS